MLINSKLHRLNLHQRIFKWHIVTDIVNTGYIDPYIQSHDAHSKYWPYNSFYIQGKRRKLHWSATDIDVDSNMIHSMTNFNHELQVINAINFALNSGQTI